MFIYDFSSNFSFNFFFYICAFVALLLSALAGFDLDVSELFELLSNSIKYDMVLQGKDGSMDSYDEWIFFEDNGISFSDDASNQGGTNNDVTSNEITLDVANSNIISDLGNRNNFNRYYEHVRDIRD